MNTTDPIQLLKELERRIRERKLYAHKPYGHPDTLCPDGVLWKEKNKEGAWHTWSNKPWQYDFHNAGISHQERMAICANRVGKSETAGYETALHLTGEYPDWWEGRRFTHPVLVWTGSPTNETSRDIVQKALIGGTDKENLGTGFIPRQLIVGKPKMRQAGVSDVVDTIKVRHISGGLSTVVLKTYEQGWRKWQGTEPDVVWLDEEPDTSQEQKRIYTEALTRLLTSHGIMMVTFTPLLGQTDLVRHYMEGGKGIYYIGATWDDAPHLHPEERERMIGSYPEHERQARTSGVPMMGEGAIFTTPEEEIKISPIEIPSHWAQIKGVDFGIDHPAAVVDIAWDRDDDVIYVTRSWKKRGCNAEEHAEAVNKTGTNIPVAWPHDGANKEKGSGKRLKDIYARFIPRMLSQSARYSNDKGGSQPVEPIILEVQERAGDGRLKVFSTCVDFFDEYRNYHRKDGKPVATHDDVLKAFFYAVMMRRYAATGRQVIRQAMPRAMSTHL